jgi:hypothetical protein
MNDFSYLTRILTFNCAFKNLVFFCSIFAAICTQFIPHCTNNLLSNLFLFANVCIYLTPFIKDKIKLHFPVRINKIEWPNECK